MFISDLFLYLWPKVRSILWHPHYKSMGEISFHFGSRQNHPKQSKHTQRSVNQSFKLTGALMTSAMSSEGRVTSSWVTSSSLAITWLRQDTSFKTSLLGLSYRDKSNDMHYDMFASGHDLVLRSNFKRDLLMSYYISFNAAWWEKHHGYWIIILATLWQKLR